jgi:fluoroquinolone transport system ATP-binding protein
VSATTRSGTGDARPAGRGEATPAIAVHELTYAYPGSSRPAVEHLSFEVAPGEIVGFLGPSGAGKSTTQQLLTGRLRGGSGELSVLGRHPSRLRRDDLERIGVSFEQPALFPKLTALEQLTFFAALGTGNARDPIEVLDRLGLADEADGRVATFSKGMRTRLDLARALLHRPEVLFLDEPTAGLDPVSAARVERLIAAERERGAAILLTTHDLTLAADLSDRVALLAHGRLLAAGTPRELTLAAGERRVVLTTDSGERSELPLTGLADDPTFLRLLRRGDVATIHTTEPSLADRFVQLAGEDLGGPP